MTVLSRGDLPATGLAASTSGFRPVVITGSAQELPAGRRADLSVDTALLRRAAGFLDDAVFALRGDGTCEVYRCPLSDTSLGTSAAGREVVAAARRRVTDAVDGARVLAIRVSIAAEKVRAAAEHFDAAEADAIPGPR